MIVLGRMTDPQVRFSFTIEPHNGSFVLRIGYASGAFDIMARAGEWPTPEKAQEIAQRIASQLLNGDTVAWRRSEP
jgi:hypothetical protein